MLLLVSLASLIAVGADVVASPALPLHRPDLAGVLDPMPLPSPLEADALAAHGNDRLAISRNDGCHVLAVSHEGCQRWTFRRLAVGPVSTLTVTGELAFSPDGAEVAVATRHSLKLPIAGRERGWTSAAMAGPSLLTFAVADYPPVEDPNVRREQPPKPTYYNASANTTAVFWLPHGRLLTAGERGARLLAPGTGEPLDYWARGNQWSGTGESQAFRQRDGRVLVRPSEGVPALLSWDAGGDQLAVEQIDTPDLVWRNTSRWLHADVANGQYVAAENPKGGDMGSSVQRSVVGRALGDGAERWRWAAPAGAGGVRWAAASPGGRRLAVTGGAGGFRMYGDAGALAAAMAVGAPAWVVVLDLADGRVLGFADLPQANGVAWLDEGHVAVGTFNGQFVVACLVGRD